MNEASPPWQNYRVGVASTTRGINIECRPMESAAHVAHVDAAIRILKDGRIKAGLVYDESVLNKSRIQVAWLSPNHWAPGYRYGNVRFDFDWGAVVQGRRFYWVESIEAYSPHALRILITDQKRDTNRYLIPYDPIAGDGPWWLRRSDGTHFRSGKFTLEAMFEGDLSIEDATKVSLVKHHAALCSSDSRCPDKGSEPGQAGARLLAGLIAEEIDPTLLRWSTEDKPGSELILAWDYLETGLFKSIGTVQFTKSSANARARRALGRAVLAAFYREDQEESVALATFLSSGDLVVATCRRLVAEAFGVDPQFLKRVDIPF